MATIEDQLNRVEAAGYDYRITRHTDDKGVHLGVDVCYRGALESVSTLAHSYGSADTIGALAETIGSTLQEQREKSRKLAADETSG